MERAGNRFGILSLHVLIWTLPFGLYWVFEQPSISQRFYYQMSVTTIALAYFGLCWVGGQLRLPRNAVLGAAILFAVVAILSSVAARSALFTVKETAFVWCGVLLVAMVAHLRLTRRQCRRLLTSLVLVAGICGLYGVLQYVGIDFRWGVFGYAEEAKKGKSYVLSVMGHPNYVTAYIGPVLMLCPGLIAAAPTRGWRLIVSGAAVVILLCVFLAGSRSAWLAAGIVGALLAWFVVRHRQALQPGKPVLVLVLAVVGLLAVFAIPNPLVPHRYGFVDRLLAGRPVEGRLYFYLAATRMIADRPILGVGYNNYGVEFWEYAAQIQAEPDNGIYRYILEDMGGIPATHAHNEYLQIAAETGVIGLAAFFILLVTFLGRLRAGARRLDAWADRLVLAGTGGAVAFVLIDGLFGFPLRLAASSQVFWLALGIGSRYGRSESQRVRPMEGSEKGPSATVAMRPAGSDRKKRSKAGTGDRRGIAERRGRE